ncbi:uncharacterized protein LOC143289611 [Babylonia areolata]|uniref:uncharacterized protein LOC143289611 n=1 Tax=Babylonia areolata TaxID=304850 RepID=UPI003FD388D5
MIPDYMDRKHDFSFARDRQLQNKLLAADDDFDQSELTPTVVSAPRPSNLRDFKFCEVTGWHQGDKVVLRKPDHDNLSKPRTSVGGRESLLTRDRSKRDLHDSTYAFHHYPESHRYIEQYRREHTCTDSTNSPTTRNEFLELQRFYAYRSQAGSLYTHPTAVGYMPLSQTPTHTATRRENSNIGQYRNSDPSLRSASRYKLSPSLNVRSDPELTRESESTEPGPLQVGANTGSTSKMAIHAVSKTPIPKVPAKVTVPSSQSVVSAGGNKTAKAGRKTGSPKASVAAWENGVGAMRTLDTLACVARSSEKGFGNNSLFQHVNRKKENLLSLIRYWALWHRRSLGFHSLCRFTSAEEISASRSSPLPELVRTPRAQEEKPEAQAATPVLRSDSENSDRVSFDRLSTTCVAEDMALKPRPRLEPSCTYHVFPGEDMLMDPPTLFTSSMLWNPAKSTLDRRSSQVLQFDPGLNNPFKNTLVAPMPVKGPDKEQMVKEFINDLKPLNLNPSSTDGLKTEILQRGLRGSGTKPDLPSTFELQGVSRAVSKPDVPSSLELQGAPRTGSRPVTHQEHRARRGRGKLRHRDGDRKAQSAHSISTDTDNSASSRSMRLKGQEREGQDSAQSDGMSAQQPSMPYFKFWNSSLPSRLKGEGQAGKAQNGEMNLRQIAELMLNDEELPQGELEELIQQRARQSPSTASKVPSLASGVKRPAFTTIDAPVGCRFGTFTRHPSFGLCVCVCMWFDSTGRAYVSLATRYEPIRK